MSRWNAITSTLSRRSLLGSLLAAGAAAAVPGSGADAAPRVLGLGPLPGSGPAPTLSSPAQSGLVYNRFSAITFIPARTVAYTSVPGGLQHSGATSEVFICPIAPVHQSTLKEVEVYIDTGPTAGAALLLVRFGSDGTVGLLSSRAVAIAPSLQTVTVAVDHLVDIVNFDYELWMSFHNAGTLRGARVGSVAPPVPVTPPPTGLLVPINPARAYDSRLNMSPDASGALFSGATRTVSIANARDVATGAVLGALVPSNATAIAYTLTVANTSAQGFLAVNPGGVTAVSASTINWSAPGSLLANTGVVKIDANQSVTVIAGGGGGTDFIIDIVGYYL